ncbi:hypothetical protein V5O48_013347, partial [Marasmius crinis-equi]
TTFRNWPASLNIECQRCGYNLDTPSSSDVHPPSDAVVALSQNNAVPSSIIAQSCRNNLSGLADSISKIDKNIGRLEDTLRLLQAERNRLLGYTQTYKQVVHPIRRVPAAILGETFLACVGDPTDLGHFTIWKKPYQHNSLDKNEPWWRLGQVCQRWREVALSHSNLWSYIAIDLPKPGNLPSDAMVSQLILQLQRSRSQPLTIALRSATKRPRSDYHSILTAICVHSSRWESIRLEFGVNSIEMLRTMSRLVRGNIPALSRLYLDLSRCPTDAHNNGLDAFALAPRLKTITVRGLNLTPFMNLVSLPWSQITQFRYRCSSPETTSNLDFIVRMPHIETFVDQRCFGADLNGHGTINVPSLRLLSLYNDYPQSRLSTFSKLLDRLSVDHLQDLRIIVSPGIPSLQCFLRRTAPTVRSLSIYNKGLDTAQMIELLNCASGDLQSLSLRNGSSDLIAALGSLDPETQKPKLLPKLHTIRIFQPWASSQTQDDSLVNMVECRLSPDTTAAISLLELDSEFDIEVETLEVLKTYRYRGLEVKRSPMLHFLIPGY